MVAGITLVTQQNLEHKSAEIQIQSGIKLPGTTEDGLWKPNLDLSDQGVDLFSMKTILANLEPCHDLFPM